MNPTVRLAVVASIVFSFGLATGCGKKQAPASAAQDGAPAAAAPVSTKSAAQIAGADDVATALEKKDYDEAMAALLRVQSSVRTQEQKNQFMTLSWETKTKLIEAAETDPKAAQALMALRAMNSGR